MSKLYFDANMFDGISRGIDKAYRTLLPSYGPSSRTVLIKKPNNKVLPTRDGASILNSLEFDDRLEDLGLKILQFNSAQTMQRSGDGTTLTAILSYHIFQKLYALLTSGHNIIDLKKQIEIEKDFIIEQLRKRSRKVEGSDDLINITMTSCKDKELASKIVEVFESIGDDAIITIEESRKTETYAQYTEGYQYDRGFFRPEFITDPQLRVMEFDNPYILITSQIITDPYLLLPVLEVVRHTNRPLVIIAPDFFPDVKDTLLNNMRKGVIKVGAVRPPSFGEEQMFYLDDIAKITGATVIRPELGQSLGRARLEHLGSCKKWRSNAEVSMIIEPANGNDCDDYIELLKKQAKVSEEKNFFKDRIARLNGGIATLFIGGFTPAEIKEKKSRVEDAVLAIQAVIRSGFIEGSGMALTRIAQEMDDRSFLKGIIQKPVEILYSNVGLDFRDYKKELFSGGKVYDLSKEQIKKVDPYKAGIVDSVESLSEALSFSVSGVLTYMLSKVAVINPAPPRPEDQKIAV